MQSVTIKVGQNTNNTDNIKDDEKEGNGNHNRRFSMPFLKFGIADVFTQNAMEYVKQEEKDKDASATSQHAKPNKEIEALTLKILKLEQDKIAYISANTTQILSLQKELKDQQQSFESQLASLQSHNDSIQLELDRYGPQKEHKLQRVLIVIICIGEYDGESVKDLDGPSNDKQKLITVFNKHYNYHLIYTKSNRVTEKDIDIILDAAKTKFTSKTENYQCIMLFWSGHGTETELISSDCKKIKRSKIESYFNGNTATEKLLDYKFMFFDACRGTNNSYTLFMDNKDDNASTPIGQRKGNDDNVMECEIHPEENRCIMYSNTNTYVSYDITTDNDKDDEKKSNDKDTENKTFSAPFLNGIAEVFTQNALEKNYVMNFSEIQDEIRDSAQNKMFKDAKYGSFCRLKVDESSTLKNKDKLSIIFSKNKDDYQHQQLIQSMNFAASHQQQNIEYL